MFVTLIDPFFHKKQQFKGSICLSAALPRPLTRKNILAELIRLQLLGPEMKDAVLVTTPRNYFIDLLLSKNKQLYYDKDQLDSEDNYAQKRLIKLPFAFELSKKKQQYQISAEIDVCMNHFQILHKIGQGTFSEIFLVERKHDRHLFCLKKINKAECRQNGQMDMIANEFEILEYTSKYKIKLYYEFQDARFVYFVVDYCPFGDLYSIIKYCKKNQQYKLTVTEKYLLWMQILFGIVSMHEKGLIYRDLKPQNILIDEQERVKICDFGYACKIQSDQKLNSLCGSYQYLAPEMIKKQGYNKSLDIYCLGLLFYELLVGSNPFEGITPKNIQQMKNKPINFEKKQISNTVRDLLKKLLKEKPQERLGFDSSLQIFRHEFFKENEDLVHMIVNGNPRMKSLKYSPPNKLEERKQLDVKEVFVFTKGSTYNYLRPGFDVTENLGPKFQSG